MDQPRQRNYYQVLQGGYPPEGPHCAAEVLRAEAKTAGTNQRACKPRTYSAAPRPLGTGAAAPAIFAYFPSLESRPPEAGPENKTHQSIEEEA